MWLKAWIDSLESTFVLTLHLPSPPHLFLWVTVGTHSLMVFWFCKSVQAFLPCPCFHHTHPSQRCRSTMNGFSSCADLSGVSCAVALCSTHILKACELLCVRTSDAVYLINRGKSAWRTERVSLLDTNTFRASVLFHSNQDQTHLSWLRMNDFNLKTTFIKLIEDTSQCKVQWQLNKDWPCVLIYIWYNSLIQRFINRKLISNCFDNLFFV